MIATSYSKSAFVDAFGWFLVALQTFLIYTDMALKYKIYGYESIRIWYYNHVYRKMAIDFLIAYFKSLLFEPRMFAVVNAIEVDIYTSQEILDKFVELGLTLKFHQWLSERHGKLTDEVMKQYEEDVKEEEREREAFEDPLMKEALSPEYESIAQIAIAKDMIRDSMIIRRKHFIHKASNKKRAKMIVFGGEENICYSFQLETTYYRTDQLRQLEETIRLYGIDYAKQILDELETTTTEESLHNSGLAEERSN